MQNIHYKKHLSRRPVARRLLVAAVILCTAGCLKDDDGPARAEWPLLFDTQVSEYIDPAVKATLYNHTGTTIGLQNCSINTFDAYAYAGNGSQLWDDVNPLTVTFNTWSWTYAGGTRQVKSGSKFYSYAPNPGTGQSVTVDNTGVTVSYDVPTDPGNQKDIMAGYVLPSDNANPVTLMFYHPFVAVRFKMGVLDVDVTSIQSVQLSGLHKRGTVKLTGGSGNTGVFSYDESTFTAPCTITQNISSLPKAGMDVGQSLLLLPQTGTRTLTVVCNTSGGGTRKYTKEITDEWKPGNMYTYLITRMELSFSSTALDTEEDIPYSEGPLPDLYWTSTTVTEGATTYNSPKPATLKFSYDKTNWYATETSGTGMIRTFPSKQVAGQTGGSTRPAITRLDMTNTEVNAMEGHVVKSAFSGDVAGTESVPIDLAKGEMYAPGSPLTTANCYIVSRPGWYCFPLVYGNAIKGGSTNEQSGYKTYTTVTGGKPYVSDAWGTNGNCHITSCSMLWTDTELSEAEFTPELFADGKYIRFQIKNTACEGNVVLCAKDASGNIAWSWHIWLATNLHGDMNNLNDLKTNDNKYTFLKYVLGSRTGTTTYYGDGTSYNESRKVYLCLFADDGSACSNIVTVTQQPGSVGTPDLGVAYQFGRKDPFPPASKVFVSSNASLLDAVRNPLNFYSGGSGTKRWLNTSASANLALWGTDINIIGEGQLNTLKPVINKTIFDPCPKGYRVPYIKELGALYNNASGSFDNSIRTDESYGAKFSLKDAGGNSVNLILPYLQHLDWETGNLKDENSIWLWTAVGQQASMAYHLQIDKGSDDHTATTYYKTHSRLNNGLFILPVKEPGIVVDPKPVNTGTIILDNNTNQSGNMTSNENAS